MSREEEPTLVDRPAGVVEGGALADVADAGPQTAYTSPLWSALASERGTLERAIARVGQLTAGVGMVLSVWVALSYSQALGTASFGIALGTLLWFTLLAWLLARERVPRLLIFIAPLMELVIAGAVVVVITRTQGAAYTLGSWVLPQLLAAFVGLNVFRMRPIMPLLVGGLAGVEFLLLYVFLLRPELGALADTTELLGWRVQIVRSFSLLLEGGAAALATYWIRRAVERAESDVRARELFGKYRLGAEVASGGMGSVYRAVYCPEGGFERDVAIKRIHPHLARDPRFVQSFRHEAELSARLLHPNIVSVFDFGRIDETYFLAMEYVDGPTLMQLARRCGVAGVRVPGRLAALIGREILEGLDFAHAGARGPDGRRLRVVHRDLSPGNVLISRTGQVKITDFGVAKVLYDAAAHHSGSVKGKLSYMAPEQVRGEPIDERSDLFACGVVLWELLALESLFARNAHAATVLALVKGPIPSIHARRDDLVEEWGAFFRLALARDVSQRFQSAAEMSAALRELMEKEGMPRPDELKAFLGQLPAVGAAVPPAKRDATVESGFASDEDEDDTMALLSDEEATATHLAESHEDARDGHSGRPKDERRDPEVTAPITQDEKPPRS
jgi:serine/threonine-protein kinase